MRAYYRHCHRRDTLDWKKRNPEKANAHAYRWERAHPEQRRALRRESYNRSDCQRQRARAYHQARLVKNRERNRLRRSRAPWLFRLYWHLRSTRKRQLPNTLTSADWQQTLTDWNRRCAVCGSDDKITADHWISLAAEDCPGTTPDNMLPLCAGCNYSKQDSDPLTWMTWRFGEEYAHERYAIITEYLATR